jgi:hypothetical protein
MYCCANCFGDSFLDKRIPEISTNVGVCDFCSSTVSTDLIEPLELLDYFQSVCSIYVEDSSSNARSLIYWFQEDWQIFSTLDSIKAQALLGEILDDGEIVRRSFIPLDTPSLDTVEKWKAFRSEIMRKNRFFFRHDLDLDSLKELFGAYLEIDASCFNNLFYRARIQQDETVIPLTDMGCPDAVYARNGRANPVGIPYLYVASTPETAIAETRPHPGDRLTVAKFSVIAPVRLLSIMHPRKTISPFSVDGDDALQSLRHDLTFLCLLENELSKPILPRTADLEYLPTQYLCEFIKNCDYDGVVFKSSISNGVNIALFDDSKVRAESAAEYEVTELVYGQELR